MKMRQYGQSFIGDFDVLKDCEISQRNRGEFGNAGISHGAVVERQSRNGFHTADDSKHGIIDGRPTYF